MAHFELGRVKKIKEIILDLSNLDKTGIFSIHDTISIGSKQFHITLMGSMIGFMMSQDILMSHQCQAMAYLELGCVSKR
jgi:hypothetical protein